MNLRALRTLVEIDRIGSFAAVADRLGMTLSAVSLQMKALEDELQLSLFDRSHRPPAMTPVARDVAKRALAILSEVDELRAIKGEDGVLRGDYRIGFVATASVRLMPEFLAKAASLQSAARLIVESGLSTGLLAKVQAGSLDAAVITEMPGIRADMQFIPMRTEAFVLAVPSSARGWDLDQCADRLAHVQFTPTTGIGLLVSRYLAQRGIEPRKTLEIDSVEAVMGCVNAGVGFAILPEPDVRRYAGDVIVEDLGLPGLERRLGLVVRRDGPLAKQVKSIAALFADC